MESSTARAYRDSLPSVRTLDIWEWCTRSAALITIVAAAAALYFSPKTFNEQLFSIFAIGTIILLALYIYNYERRKLHRYAQAVIYIHYVNHLVRDLLESDRIYGSESIKLESINELILNAVSRCFSIVTGKSCRSSIKELTSEMDVLTVARDTISKSLHSKRSSSTIHYLEDNTDFKRIWYCEDGCSRYFFSNNLPDLYRDGQYQNTSFKELGEPVITNYWFGAKRVSNWNLPYKSTIVLPIRYMSDSEIPDAVPQHPDQSYWGFLCIDCNSRSVFDRTIAPELGGTFADVLYTLYSQLNASIDTDTLTTGEPKRNVRKPKNTNA